MAKNVQMTAYDSTVIEAMATAQYRKADYMVRNWTMFGALLGLIGGALCGIAFAHPLQLIPQAALTGGAVLGCVIGMLIGRGSGERRAFMLRLMAQTSLCQVQIEKNTRRQEGQ